MTDKAARFWIGSLVVLGIAGLITALLGLLEKVPIEGIGAGATAVAAAVAGIVARSSSITWSETRKREGETVRRQHQEQVYEAYIAHLVRLFVPTEDWDVNESVKLRTQMSVWASPRTLELASRWNKFVVDVGATGEGRTKLAADQQLAGKAIIGDLVIAMRHDLDDWEAGTLSTAVVIDAIFNQ
jgi:hypothetical protein